MITALADRALLLGLVAAIGALSGWKINGWRLGEGIAQQAVDSITVVRVIERKQQSIADIEGQNGHDELEKLRGDAATAAATAVGLRKQASYLATRLATCNASTASEREARESAARVLADVLESVEQRGRAMAEAADRARTAGLTCERTYDGVRAASQ